MFGIISGALSLLKRNEEVKEDKIIIKQHSEQNTVKAHDRNVVVNKKNETSSQNISEQPKTHINSNSRFLYAVIYQTEDFEQTFLYEYRHEADEMLEKIYKINRGKGFRGKFPNDSLGPVSSGAVHFEGKEKCVIYTNPGFHGDYRLGSYERRYGRFDRSNRLWEPTHPWAFAMVKEVIADKNVKLEKKGNLIVNGCISTRDNSPRRFLLPQKKENGEYYGEHIHTPYHCYSYAGYSRLKLFNIRNYKQLKACKKNLDDNNTIVTSKKTPDFDVMCMHIATDVYTFLPYKKEGENIYSLSNSTYVMNRKEIRKKIQDEINIEEDKIKEEERRKARIESAKKFEEELLNDIDRHVNAYLDGDVKFHGEYKIDRMCWLLKMGSYEKLKDKYNNNMFNKKFEIMDKILKGNGISI